MAVVEVQAAAAVDDGGGVELGAPVVDDLAAEEVARPGVHLAGDGLGDLQEQRVAADGEPEVAQVVEGHGGDLAERVLAVEHPAVGAAQQGVGDVAEADLGGCAGACGGARALEPLALQVGGDLGADEAAGAGVGDAEGGAGDEGVLGEEVDGDAVAVALGAAGDPRAHQGAVAGDEGGERVEGRGGGGGEDVGVLGGECVGDVDVRGRGQRASVLLPVENMLTGGGGCQRNLRSEADPAEFMGVCSGRAPGTRTCGAE
ncbi:MAG: hypothetical protein R3F59_03650 [Myxococcota bacterium]